MTDRSLQLAFALRSAQKQLDKSQEDVHKAVRPKVAETVGIVDVASRDKMFVSTSRGGIHNLYSLPSYVYSEPVMDKGTVQYCK